MILFYLLMVSLPFGVQPWFARQVGPLTVEKYLGAACALGAMIRAGATRRAPPLVSTLQARAFLVFVALAALSWTTHRGGPASDAMMSAYGSDLVFFFTVLGLVDTRARLRWSLLAAIGGIGWAALYLLREWQVEAAIYGPAFRPGYVSGDANFFTASAVLLAPLAMLAWHSDRSRLVRLGVLGCLITTIVAIVLGASRGGFIGLGAALLWLAWRGPRRSVKLWLVLAMLGVSLAVSPTSPIKRFLHPAYGDVESEQIHLEMWSAAWRIIRAHPVAGIGVGNFKAEVAGYEPGADLSYMAHNTYLEIAAEMGLPGAAAFLVLFGASIREYGRAGRNAQRAGSAAIALTARGAQAGLVGFAFAALFVSAEFLRTFWLLVFLSICFGRLRREEGATLVCAPSPTAAELGSANGELARMGATEPAAGLPSLGAPRGGAFR